MDSNLCIPGYKAHNLTDEFGKKKSFDYARIGLNTLYAC